MRKDNLKTGFMDMFILETLYDTDRYGYEIAYVLKEKSAGYISVAVSALYPYLYKMEDNGWITSYRQKSGFKMERVYYHLEEKGMLELEAQRAEYFRKVKAINNLLSRNVVSESDEKIS